jgi:hypothetical protein
VSNTTLNKTKGPPEGGPFCFGKAMLSHAPNSNAENNPMHSSQPTGNQQISNLQRRNNPIAKIASA